MVGFGKSPRLTGRVDGQYQLVRTGEVPRSQVRILPTLQTNDSMIHLLYNGRVELKFTEGVHRYFVKIDGKGISGAVPSATGIVKIIDKPLLINWAVKESLNHILKHVRPGRRYDEVEIKRIVGDAHRARFNTSEKATDIGSVAHDWIEQYIQMKMGGYTPFPIAPEAEVRNDEDLPMPFNAEARRAVMGFLEWESENEVEWIDTERKIYSVAHHYAGTLDADAMVNGKRTLVDFKTSKRIYPEYFLQVAGYAMAREEEDATINYDGAVIIRISKSFEEDELFEVQERDRHQLMKDMLVFKNCLSLYTWRREANKTLNLYT